VTAPLPQPPPLLEFAIPGRLPALNELLAASAVHAAERVRGARWTRYSRVKRDASALVKISVPRGTPTIATRVDAGFAFWAHADRRDPDNVLAGAIKITLDALVSAGVLRDDSRKWIGNLYGIFYSVDKHGDERVEVTLWKSR